MASQKKKNTYIIRLGKQFSSAHLFEFCPTTPLAIMEKNGAATTNKDKAFLTCTHFPNPGAHIMAAGYPRFKEIMGTRMASTIVEYLDKETGEPVALLYPHTVLYKRPDYMARLNHASRRDLERQIAMRNAMFEQYTKQHQH